MRKITVLLSVLLFASSAFASIYPSPTNVSFGGIIAWAQPLIGYGASFPASATTGDLYIIASTPAPLWYRHSGSAWVMIGAGGSTATDTDLSTTAMGGDTNGAIGTATVAKINGRTMSSASPATWSAVAWDGSTWAPTVDLFSVVATTTTPTQAGRAVGDIAVVVNPTSSATVMMRLTPGVASSAVATVTTSTVPTMTSNAAPSGTASAYDNTAVAWYAFNKSTANGWYPQLSATNAVNKWLKYRWTGAPKQLKTVRINSLNDGEGPGSFTVYASNDDATYTLIKTISSSWPTTGWQEWDIDAGASYEYYRVNFGACASPGYNGGYNCPYIRELDFGEQTTATSTVTVWQPFTPTASDGTRGISQTFSYPRTYNVGTATWVIKDGLITAVIP
jgi:hypothetical protein